MSLFYTLSHSLGILQTAPSCLALSTVSFGRTKCYRSVVSDLKTVPMHASLSQAAGKRLRYSLDTIGKTDILTSLKEGKQ